MRLSWVPDDVFDSQNMVWHPFGVQHRKGGGFPWHPAWETTWYWRHHYLHFVNIFHPQFWRDMRRASPDRRRTVRFFLRHAISWGRD